MTLQEFIHSHQQIIDGVINGYIDTEPYGITDEERELWIMNEEYLYNLAVDKCGLEEVLGVEDEPVL